MKDKWEIVFSGIGGQGLISCGSLLGEAAIIYEGKNATLTSSYGTETRGTFTKSEVIIDNEEIYYPEVMNIDLVLSLAPVAYDRYVSDIDEKAMLIYDSSMITDVKKCKGQQFGYPITEMAREMGNVAVSNVIAFGIIVKKTGVVSVEAGINAIKARFAAKPKIIDLNIEAFNKGLDMA